MAYPETGTKLADILNPQVVGDLVRAKLINNLVFDSVLTRDYTLVGRPGNTITIPSFAYIGAASDVAEGADITVSKLEDVTDTATIKKIGKGVQLTDEALLSGFGDPLGQAIYQLGLSMADKVNADALAILAAITGTMAASKASTNITADDIADALTLFGEDINGEKYLYTSAAVYAALRKADDWCPASEMAAEMVVRGTVGMIHGCRVIVSNRISGQVAYIVKPGALALFLKQGPEIESDRDIINKSTVITASEHYVVHLVDASKAIKLS